MTENTSLDVVIVTYANRELITVCLDSLFEYAPRSARMNVYIADNASPDDTVAVVSEGYPQVTLIARASNDGFAVANNELIARTTAEYVLILNPDTRMEPGTLDHLLTVMAEEKDIGVLGCRLLTADGTLDHAAKRSFPSPASALKYFALRAFGRSGSDYVRPDVGESDVADVDAINGAFMLIRRDALDRVGGLDERYWMYGEDLDWCARFHKAGWRVVYDGRVKAHHAKGGSTKGSRPPRLNYHFHRSMVIFYLDHGRDRRSPLDIAVIAGVWLRFAMTTVTGSIRNAIRTATTRRDART